ncbi:MAG: FAD-dependent oxidoreductase, partial [Rhodobacteraceae bacterium]|nr:FAD-dependent oxidoreductase [Paracoccaceae bacterium]
MTDADTDVVIVGAGTAGLAAAKALGRAGLTFRVVEAMARIGGRAWTSSSDFGLPFDIGCAWIHAADRNPFFPEAQAAGWTLHRHDMDLDHLWQGRRRVPTGELAMLRAAETALERRLDEAGRPGSTAPGSTSSGSTGPGCADDRLSTLTGDSPAGRALATFCGPMDFGADADEISVADFRAAADLDPNYFTREGFGALIHRWGADVPVTLATPVRAIRWDGPGIAAETRRGTLSARAAIVTVSTGVLQFEDLAFYPALPDAHLDAIHDLPMGLLAKIGLAVSGTRLGLRAFDDLLVERRSRQDIFFLAFPFDLDLMVGFVGGDFAWELEAAGPAAAVDFATDRLAELFGNDIRRQVGHGLLTRWGGERWTRGAYAAATPGRATARAVLAEPVGGRIWFAGEALGGGLMQTAAGARLSGEAAAASVALALG